MRGFFADRLDELFETPNSYLVRVLRAVELAGRIADATILNRPDELAEAVARYRREWVDLEPSPWRRPLDSTRLLEALQVGLFPEEFLDDPAVARELADHASRLREQRRETVRRINAENVHRLAKGEAALELPSKLFEDAIGSHKGLVPFGGGPRIGAARLKAFLEMTGARTADEAA